MKSGELVLHSTTYSSQGNNMKEKWEKLNADIKEGTKKGLYIGARVTRSEGKNTEIGTITDIIDDNITTGLALNGYGVAQPFTIEWDKGGSYQYKAAEIILVEGQNAHQAC